MCNINNKLFIRNLIAVLGFTATTTSFILTISNPLANFSHLYKFLALTIFILINTIIAVILSWPKSKLTLFINNKIKLNIFFDDLFIKQDNIVIPVNEYFDILVDDEVVSSKTLHGQFVRNVFGGNEKELESQINSQLQNKNVKEVNKYRLKGRKEKYEVGTTININYLGNNYILLALTRFDSSNKAGTLNNEYQTSIHSLLEHLHIFSQGKDVNIPLIGAGQSGVNLSKQRLLEYLILSIYLHDNLTISGNINIILNKNIQDQIDLNKIKYLFSVGV